MINLVSGQDFDYIFQHVVSGALLVSLEGNCFKANKSACKMFGYTEEELLSTTFRDVTHPDDLELTIKKYKQALDGKTSSYQYEKRYIHKNGSIIWALVNSTLVKDRSSKPSYFFTQIQDITERRRVELALKETQERYTIATKGARIGIWDWDIKNDTLYWSPGFREILGIKNENFVPSVAKFVKRLHVDDVEPRTKAINSHLSKKSEYYEIELRAKHEMGHCVWLHLRGQANWGKDGQPVRMAGSIIDISDKKLMEAELQKSDRLLETFFSSSNIGMALLSIDGGWIKVNEALCKIIGYSKEELLKMNFQTVTHKDDLKENLVQLQKLLDGKTNSYQMEKRYIHKDGHSVWVSIVTVLLYDENGIPEYFISQVQDITERVKISEELRITKERYDRALSGASVGLWDWNLLTNELYWSPRIREMLGKDQGQAVIDSGSFKNLVHPDDIEYRNQAFKEHLEQKKPFDIKFRLKHQDGHYVYIHSRGQAIWDKEGKPLKMAGSFDDITNQTKAELALKESNELFALVVEGTRDGIWDWFDTTKEEEYWSPQYKKLLGYEENEIEAKISNFYSMLHPDDFEVTKKAMEEHLKNQTPYDVEYRLQTKSGQYKWFMARGVATKNKETGIVRMTGSITDISRRKAAELQVEENTEELERINQDLDSFAYIASHDLKEPLRGLANNAFILKEDHKNLLDPSGIKRIDKIIYLSEKMDQLINDLLYFAKLKNQDLVVERVDLNNIIHDIETLFEMSLIETNARIVLPKKLPKIICDKLIIREMFSNLISNAIKYNESDKKTVEIGFSKEIFDEIPKYVFYVKDNGIGIPEEYHDQIFRIFKRLDGKPNVKGTGVGLTFVKKIIERHGGKIWLKSKVGKGTTFYFRVN